MAKNEDAPRRRGRPSVPSEKLKRHTLSFRLADDLKDALHARAENNGRSLSEEVESILAIELYIDINMRQKIEAGLDPALGAAYNEKVQTVNECIIFLNILSRLFRDLSNLGFFAKDMLVSAWINTYMELYDIVRSAIRGVEHKALTEISDLMMSYIVDKLSNIVELTTDERKEIEHEFTKTRIDAVKILERIMKERGLK